jgi:hypothetical protein
MNSLLFSRQLFQVRCEPNQLTDDSVSEPGMSGSMAVAPACLGGWRLILVGLAVVKDGGVMPLGG